MGLQLDYGLNFFQEESPDSRTKGCLAKARDWDLATDFKTVRATVTNRVASGETTQRLECLLSGGNPPRCN